MDPDDAAEREREATAQRLVKTIEESADALRKLVPSADEAATHERVRELEFQNNTLCLRVQQLEATLRAYETRRNTFIMPGDEDNATATRTRYPLEHLELVAAASASQNLTRRGATTLATGPAASATIESVTPPLDAADASAMSFKDEGEIPRQASVQRFGKLNGTEPTVVHMPTTLEALADMQRNPRGLLTKSRSATFRVRSESREDVLEGAMMAMPELTAEQQTSRAVQNALAPPPLVFSPTSQLKQQQQSPALPPSDQDLRSGFRLLMCSDETCEVMDPTDSVIKIEHLTRTLIRLIWRTEPRRAIIIKKPNDKLITNALAKVARFLYNFEVSVLVEDYVKDELGPDVAAIVHACTREEIQTNKIDFVVCLGGDGTILWASSLFTEGVPPLVSFSMGSLGFLTPFPMSEMEEVLCRTVAGGFVITLRSRLTCEVTRGGKIECIHTVLNEVVVDRGEKSNMVHVHLYCGNRKVPITDVQGDGIIVSTPTGSTAYSLAAGGCMVHPAIPAMVVTPICPHSLSFRPFVIADATFLKLEIPMVSRSSAWVSFDGRHRLELQRGDSVVCKVSQYPIPAVCRVAESDDWFTAIKQSFLWNERMVQKTT